MAKMPAVPERRADAAGLRCCRPRMPACRLASRSDPPAAVTWRWSPASGVARFPDVGEVVPSAMPAAAAAHILIVGSYISARFLGQAAQR